MTASDTAGGAIANTIVGRNLVVDHGSVRALECHEIVVPGGSSLAIMGPSGCGKSTLLGLLGGLAVPTKGSVSIGAVVVSELAPRDRVRFRRCTLGMVYQADNLLPHLTVEENVGLQLAISGCGSGATDTLDLLDRLGLAGLVERLPDQLSGGQRQRVSIARAIVHRPTVILADEPTGALDPTSAGRVIDLLMAAQSETSASLVIVTHDPAVAERAERVTRLAAAGPAHAV